MSDPNIDDKLEIGPWIPPVFRSMLLCDKDGILWEIDEHTWRWVPHVKPTQDSANVSQEKNSGT